MAGLNLLIFIVIGQVAKETLAGPYRVISRAPWKGAILQRVRILPGNCRSSR